MRISRFAYWKKFCQKLLVYSFNQMQSENFSLPIWVLVLWSNASRNIKQEKNKPNSTLKLCKKIYSQNEWMRFSYYNNNIVTLSPWDMYFLLHIHVCLCVCVPPSTLVLSQKYLCQKILLYTQVNFRHKLKSMKICFITPRWYYYYFSCKRYAKIYKRTCVCMALI